MAQWVVTAVSLVPAMAWVQSLAWGHPQATGEAKKTKQNNPSKLPNKKIAGTKAEPERKSLEGTTWPLGNEEGQEVELPGSPGSQLVPQPGKWPRSLSMFLGDAGRLRVVAFGDQAVGEERGEG